MAKQEKKNIFGSFGTAATERAQEQQQIEAAVIGRPARPGTTGRPRKRQDATTMTISISQSDKDLVKSFAFQHSVTVSDLIHKWIIENCTEQ